MEKLTEILNTFTEIREKQKVSEELADLIKQIEDSTNPNGDVEISITRVNKVIKFPASSLISTLTGKKTQVETDRDVIVDKITINGKRN